MKRIALYARVSSDRQAKEGDSIPAQLSALRQYAEAHNYTVVGEYVDDGISGTKFDRDELQNLLDNLQNIDIIAFTKLDRWFRSVRHYTTVQERLDRAGVGWLAIWEPIYDTTTPSGRLIVNQMMSIAQFEAENTGQRIRQVFAYKAKKGEVLSGTTPAGYRVEGKHLTLSDTAPSARIAFETYARTNNLNQTLLECSGLPGLPRTKPSFKAMLMNRTYIGELHGIPGACPAIVTPELFDAVQRGLSMNVKASQRETYIFSGLLRCADCGMSLAAYTKRRQRGNGAPEAIHMYRCPGHYMRRPATCTNKKAVTETALEKMLIADIRPQLQDVVLSYDVGAGKERDASAQVAKLERKLARLKDLYLDEVITLDEYKADRAEIEKALANAKTAPRRPDISALRALLDTDIEMLYSGMTNGEKRRFWRAIIKTITFSGERVFDVLY